MMIDFEDKMPAPPMSIGERLFAGFIIVMTGYGLYANALFAYNTVMGWFAH